MTLAQEGSVLMKSAANTKLESSTSTQESWDWMGENMGNCEDEWGKAEIPWDGRGSHAPGINNSFAVSWKENELEWKMFKSEKHPSKQLKTKMTEVPTCWTCSISNSQRSAGAAGQASFECLQEPRAVGRLQGCCTRLLWLNIHKV